MAKKERVIEKPFGDNIIIKKDEAASAASSLDEKDIIEGGDNDGNEDKNEDKKEQKAEQAKICKTFECSFAPLGESSVAFVHEYQGVKKNYNLKCVDKIYTLPEGLEAEDEKRIRKALRDNGFVETTIIQAGVKFDIQKGKYRYRLTHPEQTERNNVNGTIGLVLLDESDRPMFDKDGKQKTAQVTILNGRAETDDKLIYEALLKAGFKGSAILEE